MIFFFLCNYVRIFRAFCFWVTALLEIYCPGYCSLHFCAVILASGFGIIKSFIVDFWIFYLLGGWFLPWILFSSLDIHRLWRLCLSVTVPVVITSNACFCRRLGNWEVLGRGMEEKVIVICWRWGQSGKGCRSRFLPRELGIRIEDCNLRAVEEVLVCFQPTCHGVEGSMGGVGRSKESLKVIFCCRARDKTGTLGLED